MELKEALILGFIQGVTEFLPISSTGHLVLAAELFNIKEASFIFYVFLHLATLLAIFLFFRSHLRYQRISFIIVALVPTFFIAGILRYSLPHIFESVELLSLFWLISGIWLLVGSHMLKKEGTRELTLKAAFLIGVAQGISALPGISRSGATLATAFILRIKKEEAFPFSFILSIPTIIAAFIFEYLTSSVGLTALSVGPTALHNEYLYSYNLYTLLITFIFTSIVSYLSLFLLRYIIKSLRLELFAYYTIIIAILNFILLIK